MQAATSEGQSLESVTDGAPSEAGNRPNAEHGGAAIHNVAAEHGHGVTTETSVVPPETQATVDSAERPGAPTTVIPSVVEGQPESSSSPEAPEVNP
jgi:hypothetical protein